VKADPATGQVVTDTNNAALTTVYEPGSIMKIVTASAALERGLVSPDTTFTLPPTIPVCDATFKEAEERGTEQFSVSRILAESSNVGTIKLGELVGKQGIYDSMRAFGIGEKTAIDFPNEPAGTLDAPKDWSCSSSGSIPIGQGVSVTPLQMLAAYNVIANRGVYIEPKLVGATVDGHGNRMETPQDAGHRVLSEKTADQVNVMLRGVVEDGTGRAAAIQGYTPAGKTGTALMPNPDGPGYKWADGRSHYDSSFVGFVPAEAPALSVFVKITDPSKDIFGGVVAAPAFSKIGTAALRRFQVAPPSNDLAQGGKPTGQVGTPFARTRAEATTVPTTIAPSSGASTATSGATGGQAAVTPTTPSTTSKKRTTTPASGAPPSTTSTTKKTTSTTIAKR